MKPSSAKPTAANATDAYPGALYAIQEKCNKHVTSCTYIETIIMGGEGSMMHAVKSLKANRALLKKRRTKNAKDYIGDGETKVEFKKVSDEELAVIKENIRQQARKSRNKDIILAVIVLIALGGFVIWTIYF